MRGVRERREGGREEKEEENEGENERRVRVVIGLTRLEVGGKGLRWIRRGNGEGMEM